MSTHENLDQYEDREEPFQQPLNGKETREALVQRVREREKEKESTRKWKLANAQHVIQHYYEKLGFTEAFLNGWLLKYLMFLQVRRNNRKFAVSIHNAIGYFAQEPNEDQERVTRLWMYMLAPQTLNPQSRAKGIRGFKGVRVDGTPVPIHNWINKVFAADIKREEIERQEYSYLHSQIENDPEERKGSQMGLDHALQHADDEFALQWLSVGEREEHNKRWITVGDMVRSYIAQWPKQPDGLHMGKAIVAQLILETGEMNGAEIARRIRAGQYTPIAGSGVSGPLTGITDRRIQRLLEGLKDEVRRFARKHMIRSVESNPKGFRLKPPRTDEQELSINGSYYESNKGTEPVRGYDRNEVED